MGKERIGYLDGIRGIAILLVVLYHVYARWENIVPYGDEYANIWIFKYGHLGVPLFFMLSGYVILLTLDNCANFFEFIKKRWLRLFPAMLIVSLIVYFSSSFFPERPAGIPNLSQLIPGLTFIDPNILQRVLNINFLSIEGAFWSIYVEMKFYIYIGCIFFYISKDKLPIVIVLPFLIHIILPFLGDHIIIHKLKTASFLFSFEFFGWFSIGAALFLFKKDGGRFWLIYSLILSILCSYYYLVEDSFISAIFISYFFISVIYIPFLQKVLSNKVLLFFGAISYPLYLIHENIIISLIIKVGDNNVIPQLLIPIIPFIFVVCIAFIISRYLEGWISSLIKSLGFFKVNK